jgi:DNA-3-methyladenine glycosylase
MILPLSFYLRDNVVDIARELLGKYLVTTYGGNFTSGFITETEAYAGINDRASHAYGGRNTSRTEVMFRQGGIAYIYLCYGVHSLFNVVTNIEGIPHAVLIRAIEPVEGIDVMEKRMGKAFSGEHYADGPGKLSKALGIHFHQSGTNLCNTDDDKTRNKIWIEERNTINAGLQIISTPRIGVNYAGEDAKLPYRFLLAKASK